MASKRTIPDDVDQKIEVIDGSAEVSIDRAAEKKLLRKCDLRVLPPLFVLFLMAFLDRTNIGIFSDIFLDI